MDNEVDAQPHPVSLETRSNRYLYPTQARTKNIMSKIRLSVNLNKVALIRNGRGADYPNLVKVALDCERFGAEGITIHPRPDQRHARYEDVFALKEVVTTELNIEGYPEGRFLDVVLKSKPDQVTLVPDAPGQLTSDHGWDTVGKAAFLKDILSPFRDAGIRTSLFVDPEEKMIDGALEVGADRIEFYTGPFANKFPTDPEAAVAHFTKACKYAASTGIGINAGHDLNLNNLTYFATHMPGLMEVSIGHALITDALYLGLEETIKRYLACLAAA